MKRVIIYADDRRPLDRVIIAIFSGAPHVTIPMSGGCPFVVYDRARYEYPQDVLVMVKLSAEIQEKGNADVDPAVSIP